MVVGVAATDAARERYWHQTFSELHAQPHDYLDYATAEEQAFTFGACLVASGSLAGRACLDAACGKGGFARMLWAAGARPVLGLDFVEDTIRQLRRSDPEIRWESGSVCDPVVIGRLGPFDRVFAIEVVQYVSPDLMFNALWPAIAPGGRLIGVTPNGDNPFVQKRAAERPGLYSPLAASAIIEHLHRLPDATDVGVMGFAWRNDRHTVLYDLLPLRSTPDWEQPPKRLLFAAHKAAGGAR